VGRAVVCIDTDVHKVEAITGCESYIEDVPSSLLAELTPRARSPRRPTTQPLRTPTQS